MSEVLKMLTTKLKLPTKRRDRATPQLWNAPKSYRQYLIGLQRYRKATRDSNELAIEHFQRSISIDTANALSYIGLANCYVSLYLWDIRSREEVLPLVLSLLESAGRIAGDIPELLVMKARASVTLLWDHREAEKLYRQAMGINPGYAYQYLVYGNLLVFLGRGHEAEVLMEKAREFDPVSTFINRNIGRFYWNLGEFDKAHSKLKEALAVDPSNNATLGLLAVTLTEMGGFEQAIAIFDQLFEMYSSPEYLLGKGYTFANAGNRVEALKIVELLDNRTGFEYVPSVYFGYIYAALGENDLAFEYLEKAFDEHYTDLICLKSFPYWKNVRSDSRFNAMLTKVGLPIDTDSDFDSVGDE